MRMGMTKVQKMTEQRSAVTLETVKAELLVDQ